MYSLYFSSFWILNRKSQSRSSRLSSMECPLDPQISLLPSKKCFSLLPYRAFLLWELPLVGTAVDKIKQLIEIC